MTEKPQWTAKCGHPGTPVFGTLVLCQWCDYGKTPPAPPSYLFLMYEGDPPFKEAPDNSPAIGEVLVPGHYVRDLMFIVPAGRINVIVNGYAQYYRLKNRDGKVIAQGPILPVMVLYRDLQTMIPTDTSITILP